jgi:hypothetical protein
VASAALSVNTLAAAAFAVRIDAASTTAFTDSLGQVWEADRGFNTGVAAPYAVAIGNTVDDKLYQSERWDDAAAPEMQYSIAVPNGTYTVRLHFAENYVTAAGQRVFSVDMEGARRFSNVDIFAETGGQRIALIRQVAGVTVTDGVMNIVFVHQTENPLISAIEIIGQ